jgi:hypothetical protein
MHIHFVCVRESMHALLYWLWLVYISLLVFSVRCVVQNRTSTFLCNVHMLSSKIENAHWAEKTTAARCGIRETATMRNFVLWLLLNKRNVLWHVKICHDAKVMLWLLKELTTRKLGYCGRITSHWLRNITSVLKDTMSWRSVIRRNVLKVV